MSSHGTITDLSYTPLGKPGRWRQLWRLNEPLIYRWRHAGHPCTICVPAGFITDLASVPRLLWWLIAPFCLGPAAVLHDFLYRRGGFYGGRTWTRRDVDRLFGRVMRESGVPRWKRRLAFRAVRLFGRSSFRAT